MSVCVYDARSNYRVSDKSPLARVGAERGVEDRVEEPRERPLEEALGAEVSGPPALTACHDAAVSAPAARQRSDQRDLFLREQAAQSHAAPMPQSAGPVSTGTPRERVFKKCLVF